jgi:hypothetical protein
MLNAVKLALYIGETLKVAILKIIVRKIIIRKEMRY